RSAHDADERSALVRQLRLLAVVPAQDDGLDVRHRRRAGTRTADAAARPVDRPAGAVAAAARARHADERADRAAASEQRREGRQSTRRVEALRALWQAA